MSRIVRWCLANKSVVMLATVLLIASGGYATTRLNQELLPDISFPIVTITTSVPGAGPEIVDKQVTQPIEGAIGGVGQIEKVQSTSSDGFSVVAVQFNLDRNSKAAETDLKNALEGLSLPEQAGTPEVKSQSSAEFPILNLSLSAKGGDLASLTSYTENKVVPRLEKVDGVGSVDVIGGAEDRVKVELDPKKLKEKNLSADAVAGAVSGAETDIPAGSAQLGGREVPVRATSDLKNPKALEDLPVGTSSVPATGTTTEAPIGAPSTGAPPTGAPSGAFPTEGPPAAASAAAIPTGETPKPVTLGEVAKVREVESDLSGISRTNGEPSLGINISKEQDANTVEVAGKVRKVLDDVRGKIGGKHVTVVLNSADDVKKSVSGLVEEALIGALLAILVIFAFLRSLRATLVTAVSLPTSVLVALLFSWEQNLTLNILTLAGLTIAVGRVVDDAIVVLENSYRYLRQGYEPEEAALRGTTEVASAITSSTLTTTAVFLPLAVVGGIVSKFFVPLSLTVALALFASLIVAVTVIPVLVSLFLKRAQIDGPEKPSGERRHGGSVARVLIGVITLVIASAIALMAASLAGALDNVPGVPANFIGTVNETVSNLTGLDPGSPVFVAAAVVLAAVVFLGIVTLFSRRSPGGDGLLVRLYTPVLRWSLRHRLIVVLLALLAFGGGLYVVKFLPVSFFPPSQEKTLIADVELANGTGLQQSSDRLKPFEDFLMSDRAVKSYQLSIGGEDTFTPDTPVRPDNQAQAFISVDGGANVRKTLDRIGEKGRNLYGHGFTIEVLSNGPPQGDLEAVITGGSEAELRQAADKVSNEFSKLEDVSNVQSDISGGTPEVAVNVDPKKAAKAGLSPSQVSTTLGTLLSGTELTSIGDRPVSVGIPKQDVNSLGEVRGLPLAPGTTVGDVAKVEKVASPVAISRVDGERAVTVSATITSKDTQAVSANAKSALKKLNLPGGVSASIGGETQDVNEGFRNLFFSIIVALVLVYLLLVIFFGSLLVPLVILLAVPLTTVGAFGAMWLTDIALSLPSLLGILLLIGIVVSNAILLVDFAIKAGDAHETTYDALVTAGRTRLRPILMTALATIFALLPLGLGISGGGSQLISSSLAITVIGGLTTSTFLTLLVVPVGYSLLESARGRGKRGKKART